MLFALFILRRLYLYMCPYPRISPCSACDTYFWAKISASLTNKKTPWTEIILKNVQGVCFCRSGGVLYEPPLSRISRSEHMPGGSRRSEAALPGEV